MLISEQFAAALHNRQFAAERAIKRMGADCAGWLLESDTTTAADRVQGESTCRIADSGGCHFGRRV